MQHRLDNELRAWDEVLLARHQLFVARLLDRLERAAKCLEAELADKAGAAGGGEFLAGNQLVRIAAAESVGGEPFGRGAVGLDQQRRKRLRLVLIAETVDEVFRRKTVGGRGLVAEQVADGVIVLAVGQAPEVGMGSLLAVAGIFLLAIVQRGRQLIAGKLGQPLDPLAQNRFLFASGDDALPAGVRDAIGRLVQQQRLLGVLAVDEDDERPSEGFDAFGRGVLVGEMQPRGRRHAVGIVAGRAAGLLKHRKQARFERAGLREHRRDSEDGDKDGQEPHEDTYGKYAITFRAACTWCIRSAFRWLILIY